MYHSVAHCFEAYEALASFTAIIVAESAFTPNLSPLMQKRSYYFAERLGL